MDVGDKKPDLKSQLRLIAATSWGALAALIGTKVLIDYGIEHESEHALAGAACSIVMLILFVTHLRGLIQELE